MIRLLIIPIYIYVVSNASLFYLIMGEIFLLCFLGMFLDYLVPKYLDITYYDVHDKINIKSYEKTKFIYFINVLRNMIIYFIIKIMIYNNIDDNNDANFMIGVIIIKLFMSGILSSIFFYYSHRILHYKFVHKQHHLYNNPLAVMAIYCHIIEFMSCNCVAFFLVPYLIGLPNRYILAYSFLGMINIFITHTSYRFNNYILRIVFGDSRFHHIHHNIIYNNYGLNTTFMDKIHNTYKS